MENQTPATIPAEPTPDLHEQPPLPPSEAPSLPLESPVMIPEDGEQHDTQPEAADENTEDVQKEEPAAQEEETSAVAIESGEGELVFTNEMSFHAEDQAGWQIFEQTDMLRVRNFTTGESWNQRQEMEQISSEQSILLNGGICSKLADGTILVEGTEDHPLWLDIGARAQGHEFHDGVCVLYQGTLPTGATQGQALPFWWLIGGAILISAILTACCIGLIKKARNSKSSSGALPTKISYGQLQNIGKRANQQDSMAVSEIGGGLLAVVADGMGGLKNGELVSQRIVQTLLAEAKRLRTDQLQGNMMPLVSRANDEVNRLLGPNGLYRSGSTMVAAVADLKQLSWVSVGDSRIYLYRAGKLLQLNREHNYEADLLIQAVNHQISFQEAWNHPKKTSVSSFLGMGNLKYVDEMQKPIRTIKGDRFLLCSDGVYNALNDQQIESILAENRTPDQAAQKLEEAVLCAGNAHQDNFSAAILCYE